MKEWSMAWTEMVAGGLPGPTRLFIQGQSMAPTLRPGDEVLVEPVTADVLVPGDWVVVRGPQGGYLHRYLGRRRGYVLTKGDHHLGFDPVWEPQAVMGRVVEARRAGHCFYRRTAARVRRERYVARGHWAVGRLWQVVRRAKALLLGLLAVALGVLAVQAAVTVADFYAEAQGDSIYVYWETASETSNLGFNILRSTAEAGEYDDISGFIPSEDEGAGAFYEYEDQLVTPGIVYYYKLQDLPSDGSITDPYGPVTATVKVEETETPEPTAEDTATPTPTATPQPTATPHPNVRFWADQEDVEAGECVILQWITNNVKAVYLNGRGVVGEGSQTFCPCETENHVLDVTYPDGGGEQFPITLTVRGTCGADTVTLTPEPAPTEAPSPTVPPEDEPKPDVVAPSPTPKPPVRFPGTGTPLAASPTPRVTSTPEPPTPTSSAAELEVVDTAPATPSEAQPGTVAPAVTATATRPVVHGDAARLEQATGLVGLLIVGLVAGMAFIGGGIWLWCRQQ